MTRSSSETCPQCGHPQYFVCGNSDCVVCSEPIPAGELSMRISADGNSLSCPYCGFTETGSYWEQRSIESYIRQMGATTLTEATAIDQERNATQRR